MLCCGACSSKIQWVDRLPETKSPKRQRVKKWLKGLIQRLHWFKEGSLGVFWLLLAFLVLGLHWLLVCLLCFLNSSTDISQCSSAISGAGNFGVGNFGVLLADCGDSHMIKLFHHLQLLEPPCILSQ